MRWKVTFRRPAGGKYFSARRGWEKSNRPKTINTHARDVCFIQYYIEYRSMNFSRTILAAFILAGGFLSFCPLKHFGISKRQKR